MPDPMTVSELPPELLPARVDRVAAALRAAAGLVPYGSGLLAELVNSFIPNQRIDRLTKFVVVLDARLRELDADLVGHRGRTEEFADLLEDGLTQATRALSDDRLSYLASALKNGIGDDRLRHLEKKRLLNLLAGVNDVEVIILESHRGIYVASSPFRQLHRDALLGPGWDAPRTGIEYGRRVTLHNSHLDNLRRLNLLEQQFRGGSVAPDIQGNVRAMERRPAGDSLTKLGRLLLEFIESEANVPGATAGGVTDPT